MQVTFDSDEPLDHVLAVVGSVYGVTLSATPGHDEDQPPAGDTGGQRTVKTRHLT
ncbi:hypothetical protein V2J56_04625 [Georgenia sp. MJ206]|uniref:hypothetical protein n=1 Tax=Georgenia wangjunii TaxID=3117730 RepID=UPI002F2621F8